MNPSRFLPFFGVGLLVVCFTISLARVMTRSGTRDEDGRVVIRIAHWQLETGIRDAIDTLARKYELSHPGVRIEQLAIPERVYASWLKTQLVGGTAPDLIQIGRGADDETLARYFQPLGGFMEAPNPHNAGGPLAGTPWCETFVDGLTGGESYKPNLLEYYGAPLSMFTVRMYYNRAAWRRILGDTPPPKDYDAFVAVCDRIRRHAEESGEIVLPLAGSRDGIPWFITDLVGSQTQRLNQSLDVAHSLRPLPGDIALGYLDGSWGVNTDDFVRGLRLAGQIGRFAQPGFVQSRRDDAAFYFVQGRAVMIATGSWDAPSFRAQADFEIGAFDLPRPRPDHATFGAGVLGASSEADTPTGACIGLTQSSLHPREALDFLHFITSQPGNREFSQVSGWLPSVLGVELSPQLQPFAPRLEGYVNGFGLAVGGGADVQRLVSANLGRLFEGESGVTVFQDILRRDLPGALRSDLDRTTRQSGMNIMRQDTLLAASVMQSRETGGGADAKAHLERQAEILEAQTLQELRRAWVLHELAESASPVR